MVEPSEQIDTERKDNTRTEGFSEGGCPEIISSYYQMSNHMSRMNPNMETKKANKRNRKITTKKALLDLIFLKITRQRRSCICKKARSSAWGLLANLAQAFEHNIRLITCQNESKKPKKQMSAQLDGKWDKNQAGQLVQRTRGKSCASAGRIRLKVKFGNNQYREGRTELAKSTQNIEDKFEGALHQVSGFHCCDRGVEREIISPAASVLGASIAYKKNVEVQAGKTDGNCHGTHLKELFQGLEMPVDNGCLDPEYSPDSEVINLIPTTQASERASGDLCDVLNSTKTFSFSGDCSCLRQRKMSSKKGKRKDKLRQEINSCVQGKLHGLHITDNMRQTEGIWDRSCSSDVSISTMTGNGSSNTSCSEGSSREPLSSSRVADFAPSCETLRVESSMEVKLSSRSNIALESPESGTSEHLVPLTGSRRRKHSTKSRKRGNCKSKGPDLPIRDRNVCRSEGNQIKSVNKSEVKEKVNNGQVDFILGSLPRTENYTLVDLEETGSEDKSTNGNTSNLDMVQSPSKEQCLPTRDAWVRCDDCHKWRCITATLADFIEDTKCRWVCKDNMDKDFADCSIPQEMSNAEINALLGMSDVCGEDGYDTHLTDNKLGCGHSTVAQQSSWMRINSNIFLNRSRRTQTIDEVMVCHCKPPSDGQMGCGDGCLNRMLNIECVQGTCPCGELCLNEQFQKRNYAEMKWFRCGKKGYGLQLLEEVKEGQFLIEYVGEVLDVHAYETRQREYALKGHKHFYFMSLNGSEVIDACAKGNLGRFINHSCDPNCRTEKWMVNGEVCIGLFALRDIKKGEEVTFDYNYVRVFGAAVKQCVCGSSKCRGYIGGDPLNAELVVNEDSDEEYPEPVMICEGGEMVDYLENVELVNSTFDNTVMHSTENPTKTMDEMNGPTTTVEHWETTLGTEIVESLSKDENDKCMTGIGHQEISIENEDIMNGSESAVSKPLASVGMEDPVGILLPSGQVIQTTLEPDGVVSKSINNAQQDISVEVKFLKNPLCSAQLSEISPLIITHKKILPHLVDSKRKSKSCTEENSYISSKACPVRTQSSSSARKNKLKNNLVHVKKPLDCKFQALQSNSRKFSEGSLGGRFDAVEEKLNELLDVDGGISKRKDASRGYLKLLLLTAASGDNGNGEAIQSNRDLSMILDAFLKTKSRMVLADIINKNGLQMLHNIMKRYRKEFNKIPILRKLLKVLEYLAVREILTLEHINGGPPCSGVESFKESILELTEHLDKQVHQIARNFRDRWIPRHVRKTCCMERDDSRVGFQQTSICNKLAVSGKPTEKIDGIKQSTPATTSSGGNITEESSALNISHTVNKRVTRKRKSRWDQPTETNPDPQSVLHNKSCILPDLLEVSPPNLQPAKWQTDTIMEDQIEPNTDKDAPPGFAGHIEPNSDDDAPPGFADHIKPNSDDDSPPGFADDIKPSTDENDDAAGFSLPLHDRLISSNFSSTDHYQGNVSHVQCPYELVMGHPQERFISRLPISYGIPSSVVRQFGTPQAVCADRWIVAPGMPFHPFPPMPPYPLNRRNPPDAGNSTSTSQLAGNPKHGGYNSISFSDPSAPSTSGAAAVYMKNPYQNNFQQVNNSSCSLGRKYFRQQKWNNSKFEPSCNWRTGCMESNGICNVGCGRPGMR